MLRSHPRLIQVPKLDQPRMAEAAYPTESTGRPQEQADTFLKMPSSQRQIRSIFPYRNAAVGVCPSAGAAPTIPRPGAPCFSRHRGTQPRCSNGGGTPNRWMRSPSKRPRSRNEPILRFRIALACETGDHLPSRLRVSEGSCAAYETTARNWRNTPGLQARFGAGTRITRVDLARGRWKRVRYR